MSDSDFQASDQIQKFKVTFCDLEGFGAPRTHLRIGARKIAENFSEEKKRNLSKLSAIERHLGDV